MLRGARLRAKRLLRAPYVLQQMRTLWRGFAKWRYGSDWPAYPEPEGLPDAPDPLRAFFDARREGLGIWKWIHYFDIYDRHFSRFRNREVNVLEVGIYSGGSLEMWKDYFGPCCRIYGVDIEPACRAYETDSVRVFIGDQGDRSFWKRFKQEVPSLDVVIDDGSHFPEHQIVTFEELLPHVRLGGVYLCEDISGVLNSFASYIYGFAHNLNACAETQYDGNNNERSEVRRPTPLQSAVGSIHLYPYVTVVEKTTTPVAEFVSVKRGTKWEPFFK
jgi:hypothetical protein